MLGEQRRRGDTDFVLNKIASNNREQEKEDVN